MADSLAEVQKDARFWQRLLRLGGYYKGKTIMSWNDGGTSVSKQFTMPIADILEECAYALRYFERQENATDEDKAGMTSDTSRVAYRLPL